MKVWLVLFLLLICEVGSNFAQQQTATQIIDQIKQNLGVEWQMPTVDVFKTGDSTLIVTGVAVTMMATLDVLQRAVAKGANLIITHEPVYFYHFDPKITLDSYNDPVYETKKAYIKEHNLVVWRFHDYMHRRKPDAIISGIMHKLGWENFQDKENERIFHLPQTTLKGLASFLKEKLSIDVIRIAGDPNASVSKVALSPGYGGLDGLRSFIQSNGIDVLIIGEAWEWETGEYMTDAIKENNKKGYIVLGHIPSEQAGMEECAEWLKTFIKDVPIYFVPTKEMFWTLQ
jgi:putative NIF3 family GTP cyclohydrolase 1 type 2